MRRRIGAFVQVVLERRRHSATGQTLPGERRLLVEQASRVIRKLPIRADKLVQARNLFIRRFAAVGGDGNFADFALVATIACSWQYPLFMLRCTQFSSTLWMRLSAR